MPRLKSAEAKAIAVREEGRKAVIEWCEADGETAVAAAIGVSVTSVWNWKRDKPKVCPSLFMAQNAILPKWKARKARA